MTPLCRIEHSSVYDNFVWTFYVSDLNPRIGAAGPAATVDSWVWQMGGNGHRAGWWSRILVGKNKLGHFSPKRWNRVFVGKSYPHFFGGGEIRDANNVTDAQMFHFSGWAKRNKQLYQLYFHMTSEKIRKQLSAKRFLQNVELSIFFHGKKITV